MANIRDKIAAELENAGRKGAIHIAELGENQRFQKGLERVITQLDKAGPITTHFQADELDTFKEVWSLYKTAARKDIVDGYKPARDSSLLQFFADVRKTLPAGTEGDRQLAVFRTVFVNDVIGKESKKGTELSAKSLAAIGQFNPQAKFYDFVADDKIKRSISAEMSSFRGENIFQHETRGAFLRDFASFERKLIEEGMIDDLSDIGRKRLRTVEEVSQHLRDGRKVTQEELDRLKKFHANRLDAHLKPVDKPAETISPNMMGGTRAPSPATEAALKDHEKFKGFAVDRLTAFGEANKLFEAGSSQILVQKFSQLDEMMGGFSIKQMGNPGDAKLDGLGNLTNPEVLFSSMVPSADIKPKGSPVGLVATSKADPSSVNGKILSYYDNAGNPLTPLITTDSASPDDVNRILQQLLSYKPGTEVHIHPADWEKVRGAVYERRFNELSDKLAGGQRLNALPGTGAAGNGSELDDWATAARITGRVDSGSTDVSRNSVNDIVARARANGGQISESDLDSVRRSHTAALAAENNPTSNVVREIIDTLKPQTKEVSEVQAEMAKLRTNVRAAGMLDTTPIDPNVDERTIADISEALRNGEQIKGPELNRYVSHQIGESLVASQQSLVTALQTGFNANKRMDTEQIFTQLEKIRKDSDYPLRGAAGARTASPKDINERLFRGQAISDGELTVLRSFYKRFFDAASAPADSGGGGMGIKAIQLAQSITAGMKDSKSVPPLSISRTVQYNTGVPFPSVSRAAAPIAGAVGLGLLAQAGLDPEKPNAIGHGFISFVKPDSNGNTKDDFAEFIYDYKMNPNTERSRRYFKEYLDIDLPQDALKGQKKTPEQVEADKKTYTEAVQKIRTNKFIKEPTPDMRQALLMYASVKATGVASSSNADVQDQLNKNLTAEAEKSKADLAKADADAALGAPLASDNSSLSGSGSMSSDFKDAAQFEQSIDTNNEVLIGLSSKQVPQVKEAWKQVVADGVQPEDRSTFEQKLNGLGLKPGQVNLVTELAFSPMS